MDRHCDICGRELMENQTFDFQVSNSWYMYHDTICIRCMNKITNYAVRLSRDPKNVKRKGFNKNVRN